MSAPRLEIHLDRILHNARMLVHELADSGIAVTGITKAMLGSPEVARAMLTAGVSGLGDSRIENIERLRAAGITSEMMLIRSPMMSQVDRVVASANVSLNSSLEVIDCLSVAAVSRGCVHGVVLMVELGDLREGILAADIEAAARHTLDLPGVTLRGIGTNLACQNGVVPDDHKMGELSSIATSLEARLGISLELISAGNSANLDWVNSTEAVGRVNNLRLGESILLGCETLHRRPLAGLRPDAIELVAEVIESAVKPMRPWGDVAQNAFGEFVSQQTPHLRSGNEETSARAATGDLEREDQGTGGRAIVALGRQDVDPDGLTAPAGIDVLGMSSDHLVVGTGGTLLEVGSEIRFGLDYGALLRAMTSPYVQQVFLGASARKKTTVLAAESR